MKKRLRVGVLDLVSPRPTKAMFARIMFPNMVGVMPQAVAVWARQQGHDVHMTWFTGHQDLAAELAVDTDVLFISAFTQSAQFAYALSTWARLRGMVTVLGGPHARAYPEDARKYFDYVVGLCDQETVREILDDGGPHRPEGKLLSAAQQPESLPTLQERWPFQSLITAQSHLLKGVPMIASLGCPFTCSFCVDSEIKYQPLALEQLGADLRFLQTKINKPVVVFYDPNFAVRFDETMQTLEDACPNQSVKFIAESSLSILRTERVQRMWNAGVGGLLPGIETWNDLGNKSRTGRITGAQKVQQVSEHINAILEHVPYLQANFVLGLDTDSGDEPFELTKRFVDLSPGAFPGYSLLSSFGRLAPINLEMQRAGRILPFPFHFLNNNFAMNVRPLNYRWPEFYDHVIDLVGYSFSPRRIARRFKATRFFTTRWMNAVRALSTEGQGRLRYYKTVRDKLDTDRAVRGYFEGETRVLPDFYRDMIRKDLGDWWQFLPPGSIDHDPTAWLSEQPMAEAAPAAR